MSLSTKEVTRAEDMMQDYVVCSVERRLMLLNTFLRRNVDKKVLVFCSSISVVNFLTEILRCFKVPSMGVHESMTKDEQNETVTKFSKANGMALLCTESAEVTFDKLALDWMVQYEPPKNMDKYLKKLEMLSRTTRSLIFLQQSELKFATDLREKGSGINEYSVAWSRVSNMQSELQKLTKTEYAVHMSAVEAYKAYVGCYASHEMKSIFKVQDLDLEKTARSFGLRTVPYVDIENVNSRSSKRPSNAANDEVPVKKAKLVKKKVLKSLKSNKALHVK